MISGAEGILWDPGAVGSLELTLAKIQSLLPDHKDMNSMNSLSDLRVGSSLVVTPDENTAR